MESNGPLDALPLWGVFVAILFVVVLSVECGYRLGKYRRSRHELEKEAPVGTMVGATLGLLAFILAFTFGLAAARFDARRQVLLDEANAIGTTYLQTSFLKSAKVRDALLILAYEGGLFGQPSSRRLQFVSRKELHWRATDSRSSKSECKNFPTLLGDDGNLRDFAAVRDLEVKIVPIRAALPTLKVFKNDQ